MSGYLFQNVDGVEPVSDTDGELKANSILYNVINVVGGSCALTYDAADMTVDLAAGNITHYGSVVAVSATANAFTLVSDPSNPRWTWLALDSTGSAVVVSGSPAATPTVPELGDNVALALVYVQAGLTIASNATYKIDKRIPTPTGTMLVGRSDSATATTSTSAVDLVTISGLGIPVGVRFRVAFNFRKTATNAQAVGFGIKLNSTVIFEASVSAGAIRSSANNQAENGYAEYTFMPRSTANYLSGAGYEYWNYAGAATVNNSLSDASGTIPPVSMTNALPNATITSVTIRAINGTSNNNAEVDAVRVYVDF